MAEVIPNNSSPRSLSARKPRILIAATGSVASIKIPILVQRLNEAYNNACELKIVATDHSLHFFDRDDVGGVQVLTDVDEWSTWSKMSDPVLHIELRNWADLLVIAPLDANTLAKLASGLADNLLTCILRAWDVTIKQVVLCPAMNTNMWTHPFTRKHLAVCGELGYMVVEPIVKTLACGDTGVGAMADVAVIASTVFEMLHSVDEPPPHSKTIDGE
ncbi:hypothetical protein HKX48_008232 [Thoreauomyces humboldtii]|nr:hypothetical protein HKX48_008232 [Thoreauomyces humboldtii]